jgi:hypothetical protein
MHLGEEAVGAAVGVVREEDVVAGLEQVGQVLGCAPGRWRRPGPGALLEGGNGLLERAPVGLSVRAYSYPLWTPTASCTKVLVW